MASSDGRMSEQTKQNTISMDANQNKNAPDLIHKQSILQ